VENAVAVVGLGYIGLPTAAVLAAHGVRVIGVDVDERIVAAVNGGKVPHAEPDLELVVSGAVSTGLLTAQTEMVHADVYVIAVPTPFLADKSADLSYIDAAVDAIAPQLVGDELLILESTSPPRTTEHMAARVLAARPDLTADPADGRPAVHFAHCPERVLPGKIMTELVSNDRIIGGLTPEAATRARDLYAVFCKGELLLTDATTAEMSKLVENSFRDVNIAFANELSLICDKLGIDVWELIDLANHHPRVNILQPGPGVGGHCIAVDPWFIVEAAPEQARLIRAAREVNDGKPAYVADKVVAAVDGIETPRIAALGLAFKPDIDDLRESPAIEVVELLAERLPHARIEAVEPHVHELPARLAKLPNVTLRTWDEAVAGADVVALLVDHTQFKEADRASLNGATVIDARGAWR